MNKNLQDVSSLRAARKAQVKSELRLWARKQYLSTDCANMVVYSVLELALSFPKRANDLVTAIDLLTKRRQLVPAVILARAVLETTATGCLFIHEMNRQIGLGNFAKLEREFARFYAGSTRASATHKAVHVNDGLRFLENADVEYVSYLAKKYPELWGEIGKNVEELFRGSVSIRSVYDDLSEVSHPNGLGTQYLYPAPDAPDESSVRAHYEFLCESSVWQSHHLLRALPSTDDLGERFTAAFPSVCSFSDGLIGGATTSLTP